MLTELSKAPKCLSHNRDKVVLETPFTQIRRYYCPDCGKEQEKESRKREVEARQRERQAAIDTRLTNTLLAPRFRDKTLDTYLARNAGQKRSMAAARDFVENYATTPGLIFIGGPGTGKNHLSAGIALELLARGRTVLFIELLKITRRIKESWKKEGESESEILRALLSPDILIIDEIGVQFQSETERLYLTEIINDRYNHLKPTILIGNLSLPELTKTIGERAIDRFREGGQIIIFDWESYRAQQ